MTSRPVLALSRPRLQLIAGSLLFFLVLHIAYPSLIAPWWSYLGFIYVVPSSPWTIFLATFLGVLPTFWMPIACDRPSQVVYWVLYLFVVAPISMMRFYAPLLDPYLILSFQVAVLVTFAALSLVWRLPYIRILQFQLSSPLFWYGSLVILLIFLGVIGLAYGFRLRFIDLLLVHDVRSEYQSQLGSVGNLTAYILFWSGNVLVPLVLASSWVRRSWILFFAACVAQLFLFSVGGHRTILFSILLLPALIISLRHNGERFGTALLYGLTGVVVVCSLIDLGLDRVPPPFTTTITRRLIMAPGVLSSWYLDFFSHNPKALLGWSFLRDIVDYPYDRPPSFLIGQIYLRSSSASANANFWADAYANFGFAGMFAFSAVLGGFFWLLDSVAEGKDKRVTLPLVGMSALILANTALFTAFVSHGLLLVLLLTWLMPREDAVDPLVSKNINSGMDMRWRSATE